jgi:hypothetical protein
MDMMASKTSAPKTAPAAAAVSNRKPVTIAMVRTICPTHGLAETLSAAFGLDPVDSDSIRDTTASCIKDMAEVLPMSDKAREIHLQRLVSAIVNSAFSAGTFYSEKVSEARRLSTELDNEDRDEDRDGGSGFETKAERARSFAAQMGLQAFALETAATAAVAAYAEVTGIAWKPYEAGADNTTKPARASAAAQLAAFGS